MQFDLRMLCRSYRWRLRAAFSFHPRYQRRHQARAPPYVQNVMVYISPSEARRHL